MKILIRNADNIVIYAQDDLVLDTEAHGNNWRDPNFNSSNATLAEATLPINWTGAVWSYIQGVWSIYDQAAYDKLLQAHADKTAAQVRQERGVKLTASDWTQVADAPVDKAAWAAYRQALRDIPTQAGFPLNVVWPAVTAA
jgi:hypothetical protein